MQRTMRRYSYIPKHLRLWALEAVLKLPSVSYEDKRLLPARGGVYFVLQEGAGLIYIGHAHPSLKYRWRQHTQTREARRVATVQIAFAVCDDLFVCQQVEMLSIAALQPALNVSYKKWTHLFEPQPKGKPRKPAAD